MCFRSYFFQEAILHNKTTVIRILFNLEKLKRYVMCFDLEESLNKYLYR